MSLSHFSVRVSASDKVEVIISVSKKVSKKAVVRNSIKRRVRAVMRSLVKELKPAAYLIVAKTESQNIKGEELKNELRVHDL